MGSLSLLQGIFSTQGENPGRPHCRWILYQLSHKGSPKHRTLNAIHDPGFANGKGKKLGSKEQDRGYSQNLFMDSRLEIILDPW